MTKRATWFKRLMDRRAAKGGKLVLWWRRTFGELTAEELEQLAKLGEKAVDKVKKR